MNFIQRLFSRVEPSPYDILERKFKEEITQVSYQRDIPSPKSSGRYVQQSYYSVQRELDGIDGVSVIRLMRKASCFELILRISIVSHDKCNFLISESKTSPFGEMITPSQLVPWIFTGIKEPTIMETPLGIDVYSVGFFKNIKSSVITFRVDGICHIQTIGKTKKEA